MNKILKTLLVVGSIFYLGNVNGAIAEPPISKPGSFQECSDVWGVVGEFCCDVKTLKNLVLVSPKVGAEPQQQLRMIKEWKNRGGLLVAMFGNPTKVDGGNYYCLRGSDSVRRNMSADEIKRVLLSFVHMADPDVVVGLSDIVGRYIHGSSDLSPRAKYQLRALLPNSKNGFMSQLLSDRDDTGNWLDGDSVELAPDDRQKIFIRILMQPREVSEYSCEINNVLCYLWRAKTTNARYARLYIKSRLEAKELRLSELCLLLVDSQIFGCWAEADIAMNRMIEHPEMKGWVKIYCIIIAKPWADNVIKPVMQYYTTLSWLGRKVVKALKSGHK